MRILLYLCLPILTFAQSEGRIETDRPDQTECPFIVKKGYFQAEMGFNRATSENLFPTSLDVVFTLQNDLTDRFGIGYNVGTEMHSNGSLEGIYRIAPNMLIGSRGYAYVEVFGRFPASEFADHSYDAGVAYYLSDDVKLDLSAGQSFTRPQEYYFALGLSFRLRIF